MGFLNFLNILLGNNWLKPLFFALCFGVTIETQGEPKQNWSQYVEMPDGVKLAIDVWLPSDRSADKRVPTILYATRYWRSKEYLPAVNEPNSAIKQFLDAGYAFVNVDVRGTGASFGSRQAEFSVAETNDFFHLIDWIVAQPWSNQNVATTGVSYSGNAAEHAIFSHHPALKVANPRFSDFDWYSSLVFPGGIPNKIVSSGWGSYVWSLDMNQVSQSQPDLPNQPKVLGVKPVDGVNGHALLEQAVKQHKNNSNVTDTLSKTTFRDDLKEASSLQDDPSHIVTPYRFKQQVEQSKTALFNWGSWQDSGTAAGVIARFVDYDVDGEFVIGPWNHGAYLDADPFRPKNHPVAPTRPQQYKKIIDFFEPYMFETSSKKAKQGKTLKYFTMGQNQWKETQVWPPIGTNYQTWYLSSENRLVKDKREVAFGFDKYKVDFNAGTGNQTRWSTQLGRTDVFYGNRANDDLKLLTYTSSPLAKSIEITGAASVQIQLSSTHKDGSLIVYLESVAPNGKVTMLTEGGIRLIHRKASANPMPYSLISPHRTFRREDAEYMVPNQMETITFSLLPTSIEVPIGHSIRVAIAGHDKDTFVRIPEDGQPTLNVSYNQDALSYIKLPIIARGDNGIQ